MAETEIQDVGQIDRNVVAVVYQTGSLLDREGQELEGPREVARLRGDGVAVVLGETVDVPPELVARVRAATKQAVRENRVVVFSPSGVPVAVDSGVEALPPGVKWTTCEPSDGGIRFFWNGHLMAEFLPGGVARTPGCEIPDVVRQAVAAWIRHYGDEVAGG